MTYIHYGSDHFHHEYFTPVRNTGYMPKPEDGLWASRINDEFGWEAWCRNNHFNIEHLHYSFRFELPDANILILEDSEQLMGLPTIRPWKPKRPPEVKEGELPSMEQMKEWFTPNP